MDRARLEVASRRESGHWLHAFPSASTGTFLSAEIIRIAAGLRLGVPDCSPHRCPYGKDVSALGHRGLSCQLSADLSPILRFRISGSGKNDHPQKYFVKKICDILFYFGTGNCWYEERNLTTIQQYIYYVYAIILNVYLIGNLINEFLAKLRTDLTMKEKNDLTHSLLGHSFLYCKIVMLYLMKRRIKVLLKRFFEEKREFACLDLDEESVKTAKKYCALMVGIVYFTVFAATVDGIKMHLTYGIPIRTEILLYPTPAHSGLFINILRFLAELHWWYGVTIMISVDCICVCFLVFTGYRFRTLRVYFEELGQKYQKDAGGNLDVLEEKYIKDFERGILFHKEILWCTRYVQYALGNLYSAQVVECIVLLVICLIKIVKLEGSITSQFANLSYIICLVLLTGAYMMSAGDISCEAEMIPTAIFHSGWELTKLSKKIRHLFIMTLICSQVPVCMTAFGIMVLSYNNFIMVLRSSYSFFAVMY
ncbi:uncharacterized protein LOC113240354 [Hyposmocoma kahamanoa]|uniref:uncharacterized protein LOC113240354 n=1 Tax=Hyposmocoma kahamanoa TaxID=1477025 RepID=UPI000E6D8107|nr:uncharacterized protein LOC113240354 [Hyposmocoma kahamanoa]